MSNTPESIPHAKDLLGDASTQVFLNQLLLAIVLQSGGKRVVPVAEVDATGGYMMDVVVNQEDRSFTLIAKKKQ